MNSLPEHLKRIADHAEAYLHHREQAERLYRQAIDALNRTTDRDIERALCQSKRSKG